MSVAPSADHKLLVTASRDQTIACWSLADWPQQSELGASFVEQNGKIVVAKVGLGSPAWEAELVEGDEIVLFVFNNTPVYHRPARQGKPAAFPAALYTENLRRAIGTPQECLAALRKSEPGKQYYFWKIGARNELKEVQTTLKHAPSGVSFRRPTTNGSCGGARLLLRHLDSRR